MSKSDWKENSIAKIFDLPKVGSVLDVACGLSLKSKYMEADIRVGIDIHDEYFKHIEADVPFVVMKQDIRDLSNFVSKSFDIVIALDIIEHITKEEGFVLMRECERIAKFAVVIETPLGYVAQNMDILGHGGDIWQTHRSGWDVTDFLKKGYEVKLRPYQMQKVKRHSDIDVSTTINLIDAIKYI